MQSPLTQGKDLGADPNYIPPPRLNGKVRRFGLGIATVLMVTVRLTKGFQHVGQFPHSRA
jgi:hypothetical protein